MSGMAGQMIFNGGSVNSYVTASPVSVTLAGGYLELLNWEGRAEVNTQSVSIAASATGSVRLGGTKGIEANIRATIDTALPKAQGMTQASGSPLIVFSLPRPAFHELKRVCSSRLQ